MEKILIIQTAFIGDVILSTALAEKLSAFYPGVQIDFVVKKGNEPLLSSHPAIRKVWVFDKGRHKIKNLIQLIKNIRHESYDHVINLHRFFSSGLMAAFSKSRHIAGYKKNPLSFFYSHKKPHIFREGIHEVHRALSLIDDFTDQSFYPPRLYPRSADYQYLPDHHHYICIAPTSVWYTKQWPMDKWVELTGRFGKETEVYLLGAPADREACDYIVKNADRKIYNYAGKLSLLQSAAFMEKAQMNYVNDSAPLHLASAVDAPVTVVYCSTVPAFGFYPLSSRSKIVETSHQLDCRPCGLHGYRQCPKGHFLCADIAVEDVV